MRDAALLPEEGATPTAASAKTAHRRFGQLHLDSSGVPHWWQSNVYFQPAGCDILLRFERASERPGPTMDQELFYDYLEVRFGLALTVVLRPLQRALHHYARPVALRSMLDEFRLVSLSIPAHPIVAAPRYELGYESVSAPALSFVAMVRGWLTWPPPWVRVRVDAADQLRGKPRR